MGKNLRNYDSEPFFERSYIMKYIVNGRIVMPDRIIDGKALAYDEKISGVVKTEDIPAGAEVIDAK